MIWHHCNQNPMQKTTTTTTTTTRAQQQKTTKIPNYHSHSSGTYLVFVCVCVSAAPPVRGMKNIYLKKLTIILSVLSKAHRQNISRTFFNGFKFFFFFNQCELTHPYKKAIIIIVRSRECTYWMNKKNVMNKLFNRNFVRNRSLIFYSFGRQNRIESLLPFMLVGNRNEMTDWI